MKLLQLNAWCFNFGEDLLDFVAQEKPDILNLQEVTTHGFNYFGKPISKRLEVDYFRELQEKFGYQGVFAPTLGVQGESGQISYFGNAFLTKLPIVDFAYYYDQTSSPLIIPGTHEMIQADKQTRVVASWSVPANILTSLVEYQGKVVRNLTTHFRVTHQCSETDHTVRHAQWLARLLDQSKNLPTILSGDFNIHPQSYSIRLLEARLAMVNHKGNNTLNSKIHPAILNGDLPQGVKVDYVFQKRLAVNSVQVLEISLSDHLPIVAELDIA
jgi:endonuclease/exonuclease/phosphatase family metal-dependent hydrolase